MAKKFFRFFCRVVPSQYKINPDLPIDDQPIFTQNSVAELNQMNIIGMPLYFEHIHGITQPTDAAGNNLLTSDGDPVITYADNRHTIGYVVHKVMAADGSLLALCEIPPVSDLGTATGKAEYAARNAIIQMIVHGTHSAVSLSHRPHSKYDSDLSMTIIKKYPLELSVTSDPARVGSDILEHYYAEESFKTADEISNFDVYKSASTSAILQEHDEPVSEDIKKNEVHEKIDTAPTNSIELDADTVPQHEIQETHQHTNINTIVEMSAAAQQATAAAAAPAAKNPELVALLQQLEEAQKANARLKSKADEFDKIRENEDAKQRQRFIDNSKSLVTGTQDLLKALLASGLPIESQDKAVFEDITAKTDVEKLPADMTAIMMKSGRDSTTAQPAADDQIWTKVDDIFSSISAQVVSCSAAVKYMGPILENYNKMKMMQDMSHAKKATDTLFVAAQPQQQQPARVLYGDFDQLKRRAQEAKGKLSGNSIE